MKRLLLSNAILALAGIAATAQTAGYPQRDATHDQLVVTSYDGTTTYYNADDLTAIDLDGGTATLTVGNLTDMAANLKNMRFLKATQPLSAMLSNPAGCVKITEASGWCESAYAKFELFDGAKGYNAYVAGGPYPDFIRVDQQLVRNYGTYGRVDVVGLPSAYGYQLRIVPIDADGNEMTAAANVATHINVSSYSREGFAHKNWSGVGAYNDNGTLKAGARVLYVTKSTAKTVTCSVVTNSKGGITECTGLQAIIDAYQKGYDTTPLAVRIIGKLTASDMDSFSSSEEGIQIKGKKADSELNITIEGIGDDATIHGFGFLCRNARSVEFRNLGIMRCMDDGISLDTDNSNIWIHNIDVFYGKAGSGDHAKGDGAVDVKSDSKYVTVDHCRFWDTGKSNMFGMKSESGPNYISYHHNWFDHSDSRHPRVRTMSVHVWNNYFDNCAKYGVGATSGASVFVENNYFLKTKKPILCSQQGTDALGSGTFSGEDGGMIKAYGNYMDRTATNFRYYIQGVPATTGYDAYETETRYEAVPETEVARVGGTKYNNFDTDATLMYAYQADEAADVPEQVTGYYGAGRMNHGDVSYTFKDNVGNDDTDSAVDSQLSDLIDSYTSEFVSFFGEETGEQGGEQGGGEQGGDVNHDGTITCSFDKSGNPSNSFFTVNGNGSNSKGQCTLEDGTVLTTCLKMEQSTYIRFTTTATMTLSLYFGDTETGSIKVDGVKMTSDSHILTTTLQAGDHELTKADVRNLFYIKLLPASNGE